MSSVATRVTPEEYLERERKAETKSEYRNGEIVAMAGASPVHTLIDTNVAAECHRVLKSRQLGRGSPRIVYLPDVMAICGQP